MRRADLTRGTVYAYRTHHTRAAQPVLLAAHQYLWRPPDTLRSNPYRRDETTTKCRLGGIYPALGYLVIRPAHDLSRADQLDQLAKVTLPEGEFTEAQVALWREQFKATRMTFDVVSNAHLPGTWEDVMEAESAIIEADRVRRAEADAKARAVRDRFNAACDTVKAAVPGLYSFSNLYGSGHVDMTLTQFEQLAAALAELDEHRAALADAVTENRASR